MSFQENFYRNTENSDLQFDTNAFYPVLTTFILILLIITVGMFFQTIRKKNFIYNDSSLFQNCQCCFCLNKLKSLIEKHTPTKTKIHFFLILISLFIYLFIQCCTQVIETHNDIKIFDPFEILQISKESTLKEIKKAYKKLALKYHPDKNINNIQAKAMFILITKAYNALTNEEMKNNFEMYGNPDGRGSMRISIGLPSFIIKKNNHFLILIIFVFFVSVLIPHLFIKWIKHNKRNKFKQEGNITVFTKNIFFKTTGPSSFIGHIPFHLGLSYELRKNKKKLIKEFENEIKNEFNNNMEYFPLFHYDKLSLSSKNIINKTYRYFLFKDKFSLNEKEIIIISNLIDMYFVSQIEKYILFKFNKLSTINPKLSYVKKEFIFDVLLFQQCFYQGISLLELFLKTKSLPYLQLPFFTNEIIQNNSVLEEIPFRTFLSYSNEMKTTLLSTQLHFSEQKTKEIISASKSFPLYKYKTNAYVEGFPDFIVGDLLTVDIYIERINLDKKKLIGLCHCLNYPGFVKESIQIIVLNGDSIIHQDKILITNRETLYTYRIKLGSCGNVKLTFEIYPTCYVGLNDRVLFDIPVAYHSIERDKMLNNLELNKVKIEPSFFQKLLIEAGMINEEEDEEELEKQTNGGTKEDVSTDDNSFKKTNCYKS